MDTTKVRAIFVAAIALAFAVGAYSHHARAASKGAQDEGGASSNKADYLHWALPAEDQKYGSIDGHHIWQYVKEQSAIAEKYRDDGHPQFWGRIVGTSGDVEDIQWLQDKYRQAGLTDVHAQPVRLFCPNGRRSRGP